MLKILFYDVENSPNIGYTWGKYQQDVIDFKKSWELISVAWKWAGEKNVSVLSRRNCKNPKSDKEIALKLRDLMDEADVLITHNGIFSDNRKAYTRFLVHKLAPPSSFKNIDTYRVVKNGFNFNSNKLESLTKTLGLAQKMKHSGFQLWLDCMDLKKSALLEMEKYNKQDVVALEQLYLALRPYIVNHPNIHPNRPNNCRRCGSKRLASKGYRYTNTRKIKIYRCKACTGTTEALKSEPIL